MAEKAASQHSIEIGMVLAGTYRITRLLGKGGMGSVWEAKHARLEGTRVAIKVLHTEVAEDPESVARFQREAQIASRLGHPNIVHVIDINQLENGAQYLVLEYLEGQNLAYRLFHGGPLPVEKTLSIIRQVGSALYTAHQEGIIHRDLKPHNIFLCPTETDGYVTEVAKVLDFGISKIRGSQTVKTQTAIMLGTPQYMAPEQAMGAHDLTDGRTDIFALGAIVYEMLSGQPAFQGQNVPEVVFNVVYNHPRDLGELVPGLPPHVLAAVRRAMAKQQNDRFADVSDFVEALTGNRLVTMRGDSPPRSKAKPDAFAETVAPSTGQKAMGATAMAATAAPSSQAGTGVAGLQAAGSVGQVPLVNTSQPTVSLTVPPQASTTARVQGEQGIDTMLARDGKTSIRMMISVAITLVAGAAIAILLLRSPDNQPAGGTSAGERADTLALAAKSQAETPERAPGAAPAVTQSTNSGSVESGTQALVAETTGADKPVPEDGKSQSGNSGETASAADEPGADKTGSQPRATPTPSKEKPLTPEQEEIMKRAEDALAQKNPSGAMLELKKLLNQQVKRQDVYFLFVKASCADHDLGAAQDYFGRLSKSLRTQAKAFCKRYEIEVGN